MNDTDHADEEVIRNEIVNGTAPFQSPSGTVVVASDLINKVTLLDMFHRGIHTDYCSILVSGAQFLVAVQYPRYPKACIFSWGVGLLM